MNSIEPQWMTPVEGGFRCGSCFRACVIPRGSMGACRARGVSPDGEAVSPYLGAFVSVAIDPIEKKPLRMWRPGTSVLSLGSLMCNMTCPFCQNHEISHPSDISITRALTRISPEQLRDAALSHATPSVAFTYNEPTLQAEYICRAAPLLRDAGVGTVMVTNGLFGEDVRDELASCVDAMNIDVKTFSRAKYAEIGGDLDTVKSNVDELARRGVHIELTLLVVPGVSDSIDEAEEMTSWIASISPEIPLHITRYHPAYRYREPATDIDLMKKIERAARSRLAHVYLGNV